MCDLSRKQTPEVIPAEASNGEREPGSSNPDCAMRTDRGYRIPAFAGMTGVSAGTRGDDGSVCGMIAVLCVLACARMTGVSVRTAACVERCHPL